VDGGEVDLEQFYQLHAGLTPDGQALLMTTGREVDGVDITFSPAKSVSLAYARRRVLGFEADQYAPLLGS
jgi:hypothetical protein